MELLQGTYMANQKGFGFVKINEESSDIFISKENSKGAMNNDVVEINLLEKRRGDHIEGRVVNILKRNTNEIVGTFKKSKNFGFVVPDDKKIGSDIFISKSNWGKAKNNQKVVVQITKYPIKDKKAEGKITEILGFNDETGVDMLSIVKQFKLPYEFPNSVIKEAKKVSKETIVPNGRLDLRDKEIFTIDGDDAKDLDDAVYVEKNTDGTYTLGVSIADVSYYVKPDSNLDREAITRGTSVYMLDRVIPMLPTELSNGICSLNQGEDRYALSVIMNIDSDGKVIDSDIRKSIINVTRRMTYKNVEILISGEECNDGNNYDNKEDKNKRKIKNEQDLSKDKKNINKENAKKQKVIEEYKKYQEHFLRMKELAKILKKRREKDGYLSLDIPESKITLDKFGTPIDVRAYETGVSNEIIEQFMLTANETVAERFFWLGAPFIYRVHEKPDEEKIAELNKYLFNFGYKIKGKKDDIKPKAFSMVLKEVKGKDEEGVVSNLLLRTLKVARYEAENKGHFGIASKYYCHFTSPIRRYPDLFIHRVISEYLDNAYNINEAKKEKYYSQAIRYADRSSECEQIATKAERESEDMKMAEYMESKIGEEYDGIISSITKFGMFVRLENTVEGLIRLESLDDYYIYDDNNKSLIGKHTNNVYKLGDKVTIEVINANKERREIDFRIVR